MEPTIGSEAGEADAFCASGLLGNTTPAKPLLFGLSPYMNRKAERLLNHNRIRITDSTPSFWTFLVEGTLRSYECYIRIDRRGMMHCSCNSDKEGYSCVFSNRNRSQPYCSHTLAAYLLLRRDRTIDYDEEEFLEWQHTGETKGYDDPKAIAIWDKNTSKGRRQMMTRSLPCETFK